MPQKKGSPALHVTVADVARLAQVSTGAVSAVLNNRAKERGIGKDTANRIREAARQLGYKPNISARLMRRGSASQPLVIALITSFEAPEGVLGHAMNLIRNIREAQEGRAQAIQMVIEMFAVGKLSELPGLLAGADYNLAIITNTGPEDDAFLTELRFAYPVVMLNRHIPGIPGVVDSSRMGDEAAAIFVQRGRSRFAVLHGLPETQATLRRKDHFLQTATAATGKVPAEIVAAGLSQEAGFHAMTQFLQDNPAPDALYCVMDTLAIGAYRAIRNLGLRIPGDILVLGVGDNPSSPFLDPPLSSVGPSHQDAMQALSRLIEQALASEAPQTNTLYEVPIETHLRASTGD